MSQMQRLGPKSGAATGDVTGPGSSTDNAIVRWNGTTGKIIQNSGTILDDSDNIFFVAGMVFARHATAVSYTVLDNQFYIGVTDTTAPRTISLPAAPLGEGQYFIVKDESGGAGTNNITVNVDAAATTIDGSASVSIDSNYGALQFFYDGTQYRVISREISLTASDTTADVDAGIQISGTGTHPDVQLTNQFRGADQTTDDTVLNLITFPLTSAGSYIFDIDIVAFNETDVLGAGYNIFGTVRSNGTDTFLCGTPDKIVNEEAGMTACNVNLVVGGLANTNAYLQVTGLAAPKTINWKAKATYMKVS